MLEIIKKKYFNLIVSISIAVFFVLIGLILVINIQSKVYKVLRLKNVQWTSDNPDINFRSLNNCRGFGKIRVDEKMQMAYFSLTLNSYLKIFLVKGPEGASYCDQKEDVSLFVEYKDNKLIAKNVKLFGKEYKNIELNCNDVSSNESFKFYELIGTKWADENKKLEFAINYTGICNIKSKLFSGEYVFCWELSNSYGTGQHFDIRTKDIKGNVLVNGEVSNYYFLNDKDIYMTLYINFANSPFTNMFPDKSNIKLYKQ